MKKARLITTLDCVRSCKYCCNNYKSIMNDVIRIKNLDDLFNYSEVIITGGEPTLYPERVKRIVNYLRKYGSMTQKIFMYTTMAVNELPDLIKILDGVHYSLHEHYDATDEANFMRFQRWASKYGERKSFRLYINPAISQGITIYPDLYKRVEVKPWIKESDLSLPEGEELLIYKPDEKEKTK